MTDANPPPRRSPAAMAVVEDIMRIARQMDDATLEEFTRELIDYVRRRDAGEKVDMNNLYPEQYN